MDIKTSSFSVDTRGTADIIDITAKVQSELKKSGLKEGSALVFVPGSVDYWIKNFKKSVTLAAELLKDYPEFFEKIIPSNKSYHHDETWHDANGYSHVRASLQGASFTVPFNGGELMLGTWQQIILVDFDNRSRKRNVIVQLTGL